MQCAEIRPDGVIAVAQSQPVDVSSCVAVIASPSDFTQVFVPLTAQQGAEISLAIGSVWAVAYAFRVLIRLGSSLSSGSHEDD